MFGVLHQMPDTWSNVPVPGLWYQVPGARYMQLYFVALLLCVSNEVVLHKATKYQAPGNRNQVPGSWYLVSGTRCPAPGTRYLIPGI